MIKAEIRSSVLNSLLKWDSTARYHPRFLDAIIEQIRNEMLMEVWRANPLMLQNYIEQYGYDTPLAVSYESTSGIYYTTLPENIVIFPDKASGVRRMAPHKQTGIRFYPMDAREWDLVMGGSYVNTINNKIGYIVNTTRIEYYGMTGTVEAQGVRADLIIPFSEYTDVQIVPCPAHLSEDGMGFIDRCVAKLRELPPKVDLIDNNKEE